MAGSSPRIGGREDAVGRRVALVEGARARALCMAAPTLPTARKAEQSEPPKRRVSSKVLPEHHAAPHCTANTRFPGNGNGLV